MHDDDALRFAILWTSASYIAVPKANPSLYIFMSLALTFPLQQIVSISVYLGIIDRFWT